MEFGKRLRKLRERKKITQKDLAAILNVSESAIGMYERGEREPNFDTTNKIASYFDVKSDYLLGRTDEPFSKEINNGEMSFYGGPQAYSEDELEVMEAALKTYREQKAKFINPKKKK